MKKNYGLALAGAISLAAALAGSGAVLAESADAAETEAMTEADSAVYDFSAQIEEAKATDTTATADSSDLAGVETLSGAKETGIAAADLVDGSYEIGVECSSSMFKVVKAVLTVKDGSMSVDMTMGGTGYMFLYPGTTDEAAKADAEDFVYYTEEDGVDTFRNFPLEELDKEFQCAAFSKNKQKWYPRTMLLESATLPSGAFAGGKGTSVSDLGLADGSYTVDVTLGGASGKTAIDSPAELTVADGKAIVLISFNTDNYDYVKVDGEQIDMEEGADVSRFQVPVSSFDAELPFIADSVAIKGHGVEKDYTLTLDSASIRPAE